MPVTSPKRSFNIDVELANGIQFHQSGHLQRASEIYKKILSINPDHGDACHLLGFLSLQQGSSGLAADLIQKAIISDPDSPLYNNSLGLVFSVIGQHDKAIASFRTALDIYPEYGEAHRNLGNIFLKLGRYQEAAASYQSALRTDPENAELHHHLGRIMEEIGNFDEAICCYRQTLEIAPQNADACNDLGLMFRQQGKFAEALSNFQKAVEINPEFAEAHNNLGNILQDQGHLEEACGCYRQALMVRPDFAKAHSNLGIAYQGMGKSAEAVACFRKAVEIEPDFASAYRHLVHQLQRDCSWTEMAAPAARLDHLTQASLRAGERPAEDPFLNLTRHAEPADNLAVARAWSADIMRRIINQKPEFSFANRRGTSKPITIGYLSNNFHDHPMAHLLLGLLSLHDRNDFAINCYSFGKHDASSYRQRIRQDCDKFVDLRSASHLEAAQIIYNDQVDILVDLMGHTKGSRMEICALRPAPIQIRYLGLAGTTGADFFDYLLTDKIVTPDSHAPFYSENFVYLPHCYQINSYRQTLDDELTAAGDCDLSDNQFVFCSFNQDYKIEPILFKSWMRILQNVPSSVLWLMVRHQAAKKNLRREATEHGVNPERLVFLQRQPKALHLKRLKTAGLALDTRVVNGAATTSDALWAGVPVITIKGTHFASRMSASILNAVGMPELIAHSIEEYEAIAVQLATNSDRLASLRQKLAKNRLTEPLFDTPRFVVNLEKAYRKMWQIFNSRLEPRQFEVIETPFNGCHSIESEPKNHHSFVKTKTQTSDSISGLPVELDDISVNSCSIQTAPVRSMISDIRPAPTIKKIAFFCGPNDSFLKEISSHLSAKHEIRRFEGKTVQDMQDLMKWSDLSWFEWCDRLVMQASSLPKVCRVICRLHRYEVFTEMPKQINWQNIDDLIFVTPHIRELALRLVPELNRNVRTHIIRNGIDTDKYHFTERSKGCHIAFIGYIHQRKNPSLLLQCMRYLVDIDERYVLHIAGKYQDLVSKLYFDHMVQAMKLEANVKFYGWVDDIVKWLADKQYILSTSLHESFGYGIAEAMACGIKPLIHNFIGANEIYPEKYRFNSIDEFSAMLLSSDYHSVAYRKYIEDNFSLTRQLQKIEHLLEIDPAQNQ